jgi:hypothetical protein
MQVALRCTTPRECPRENKHGKPRVRERVTCSQRHVLGYIVHSIEPNEFGVVNAVFELSGLEQIRTRGGGELVAWLVPTIAAAVRTNRLAPALGCFQSGKRFGHSRSGHALADARGTPRNTTARPCGDATEDGSVALHRAGGGQRAGPAASATHVRSKHHFTDAAALLANGGAHVLAAVHPAGD